MNNPGGHEFADLESVIQTLYSVISGEANQARDWAAERRLFHPSALSIRTSVDSAGKPWAKVMTLEEFIADCEPYFAQQPFYESEIARKLQRFGNIAHVSSVYECRRQLDDAVPFMRGINSIQLYNDGERWWVMSILWDNERDDNPLGDEHLGHRS